MDLIEILKLIAIPRPNHSENLDKVIQTIKNILESLGIPFITQDVTLMPFKQFFMGITCLVLSIIFFLLIIKNKPVFALVCTVVIPVYLILEVEFFVPITSSIVMKKSENIIMTFDVPEPERELIFAAHMDSKTDFYDHIERRPVLLLLMPCLVLGLLIPVYFLISRKSRRLQGKIPFLVARILGGVVAVYWFFFFLYLGGFIFIQKQSPGAVDDGTAVVSLIALADQMNKKAIDRGNSRVTILLTTGEEVGMQGANAYVRQFYRTSGNANNPPPYLINLELVGQGGTLFYWEKVGLFLKYYLPSPELAGRMKTAWQKVSEQCIIPAGIMPDDSFSFLSAGIPSITIGHTGKPGPGFGDFHTHKDNVSRVDRDSLELMIPLFKVFIESYE